MRKKMFVVVLAVFLAVVGITPAFAHGSDNAGRHRQLAPASVQLQRDWVRWALGSKDVPFLTPDYCGRSIDGVFYLTAAISAGLEFDCTIPSRMPILVSPAGDGLWAPTFGTTREQLKAALADDWALTTDVMGVLDGQALDLSPLLQGGGVYGMHVADGSFIKTVDGSFPANRHWTRVASVGYFGLLRLPCGHHDLSFSDSYNGTPQDVTFHIWSRCHCDR
jgi:hypothetical protein